jgi:hypothetical protein
LSGLYIYEMYVLSVVNTLFPQSEYKPHCLSPPPSPPAGVDVVLNSLAGDKLKASLKLLATDGHFLEIGKFDLTQNSQLGEWLVQ